MSFPALNGAVSCDIFYFDLKYEPRHVCLCFFYDRLQTSHVKA